MEKDFIKIKLINGQTKDMELILLYSDDETGLNYIFYKDPLIKDECYIARYLLDGDTYRLDTNLTNEELNKMQLLLNSMIKAGK